MTRGRRKFETDRSQGMALGVCAGVARQFGVDVTFVRVGLVLATLMGAWPWTVILYLAAAWLGRAGKADRRALGREALRQRMRSQDLRIQAIESYVTSSNSRLAREIEDLR